LPVYRPPLKFRRLFCRFIDHPFEKNLRAVTQKHFAVSGKDIYIDVGIVDAKGEAVIVIENKVNSPLTLGQLRKYNQAKRLVNTRKIAIVKSYFESLSDELQWPVYHWADLYGFYSDAIGRFTKQHVDRFIIQNFLDYLKVLQMQLVRKIAGRDLKELAKAIYAIRNSSYPEAFLGNKSVFQVANDYMNMLGQIVNMARKDEIIFKRWGKSFKFNPWIGWWSKDNDDTGEKGNVWIGIMLYPQKKFKNISYIAAGLEFDNHDREYYKITMGAYSDNYESLFGPVEYKGADLEFEKYATQVIKVWKKWVQ